MLRSFILFAGLVLVLGLAGCPQQAEEPAADTEVVEEEVVVEEVLQTQHQLKMHLLTLMLLVMTACRMILQMTAEMIAVISFICNPGTKLGK